MADIDAIRNDSNVYRINVTRSDPDTDVIAPVNLTGAKLWFTVKQKRSDADAQAVVQKGTANTGLDGIEVTDAGNGRATLTLQPSDTASLGSDLVYMFFDLQLFETAPPPQGTYTTICRGQILVTDDITLSA